MEINWKKQGYEIGKEVCIISSYGLYTKREEIIKGIAIYVGVKNLKVKLEDGAILFFKGRRFISGGFSNPSYSVYASEEEYNIFLEKKEDIERIKTFISDNLKKLNYKQLKEIEKIIRN